MARKKKEYILEEFVPGNVPLSQIILEWAVSEINRKKGFEFAKIKQ